MHKQSGMPSLKRSGVSQGINVRELCSEGLEMEMIEKIHSNTTVNKRICGK